MVTTKTVQIPADSELSRLLRDAMEDDAPLLIATGRETYRVEVVHDIDETNLPRSRHKPTTDEAAASRAAIFEAAGSWKDVDVEAFKAYLAERRRTANRPSVKL